MIQKKQANNVHNLQQTTLHQINCDIADEQDNILNSCVEVMSVKLTKGQILP